MRRTLTSAVFAVLVTLVAAAPAYAGAYLDEAVAALKSAPVFVAAGTEGTNPNTAIGLKGQLNDGDNIVIAMLPEKAASEFGGEAQTFAQLLDDVTGKQHIVIVSIGDDVAASTRLLPEGVAADQLNRAASVSTSTQETIVTFIRNVHSWQSAHPEEVAKRQPESEKGEEIPWDLVILSCASLFSLISTLLVVVSVRRRGRRQPADPKIKLRSPDQLRDELRGILDRRAQIRDQALRETITRLVQDTEELFKRLRANAKPAAVDEATTNFESHLQSLLSVLDQYIDVQNNPRYYEHPADALHDGREAIDGFAEYALNSARRAGRQNLTAFRVNTKILSAQKYS